jgi:hypothetical protein
VLRHDDLFQRHRRAFQRAGIVSVSVDRFLSARDLTRAQTLARTVCAGVAPDCASAGDRLAREIAVALEASLRPIRPTLLRWVIRNYLGVMNLVEERRPGLLVIPDERQPLARAVADIGRRQGIPVISVPEVQDQLRTATAFPFSLLAHETWVCSEALKEQYVRCGARDEHVRITVSSGFLADHVRHTPTARSDLRRHARWPTDRAIVLFSCQGLPINEWLFRELATVSRMTPRHQWIVRPHPSQSQLLLRALLPRFQIDSRLSMLDAIDAADILVTHSSMHLVHAILRSKPAVMWSPDGVCAMPVVPSGA